MKRNKSVFPALLFAVAVALLLASCECPRSPTVGEELCSVGCAQVGGKFLYSVGHRCVCEFELPHLKAPAASNDNPKGTSTEAITVPPRRVIHLRSNDATNKRSVAALARVGGIAYTEGGL